MLLRDNALLLMYLLVPIKPLGTNTSRPLCFCSLVPAGTLKQMSKVGCCSFRKWKLHHLPQACAGLTAW